jgi:hypothetical protein
LRHRYVSANPTRLKITLAFLCKGDENGLKDVKLDSGHLGRSGTFATWMLGP